MGGERASCMGLPGHHCGKPEIHDRADLLTEGILELGVENADDGVGHPAQAHRGTDNGWLFPEISLPELVGGLELSGKHLE